MEYKDLSKNNKAIYNKILEAAAGKTDTYGEDGQPLHFDKEGKLKTGYHYQVLDEMIKRKHLSPNLKVV